MRQRIRFRSFRTSWGLSAAAAALVGAPAVAEPLAEIAGLPDGPVLDVVRAAVGEIDEPVVSILDARRRADRARDRALAALRSEGYYAARVDAQVEPGEPPRSRLEITAGRRFVMGAVSVELVGAAEEDRVSTLKAAEEAVARSSDSGNADDDLDGGSAGLLAAGLEGDGLRSGVPARAEDVIAAEARAVAAVIEAGHPDVRGLDLEIVVDHARGAMDVILRIDAGRRAVLGPVRTAGDARLREAYVARLAPFATGDLYDQEALDTLGTRLRETGAFESVSVRLTEPEGPVRDDGRVVRPVIVEVLPVFAIEDAEARAANDEFNKGYEAAAAAIEMIAWRRSVGVTTGR